ncbi:TPA: hypothetical protein ACH3X1_000020 [Trebouxia sp. C0004]
MANNMQLFGKGLMNNSMLPVVRGFLPPSVRDDDVEVRNTAKRQRLSIPEYDGRSASDPPLSFARRHANAVDMPVEAFKLGSISQPPSADLPKALCSLQSGPLRSAGGRPSLTYRIYSNAFQGGRVSGDGGPFYNSSFKAANASSLTRTNLTPSQKVKVISTPYPTLLKQPLLGKRPSSSGPILNDAQQQQPDQAIASDSAPLSQEATDPELSIAQAELTARLQHMQSVVRGNPSPSLSVSSKAKATCAPQPSASSKHSVSHDTHSNQDTEMDSAPHGSHGPSHKHAPDSFKESGQYANGVNPLANGHDRSPLGGSRRSPSPFSRDCASHHFKGPVPVGDGVSLRSKDGVSSRDGASPLVYSGMPCRNDAGQGWWIPGQSQFKLPSKKCDSSKTDLTPKGHLERPWNNRSSALQPSVSPPVTKSEPVTTAQLQSTMASCMKKNRAHQDKAVVNITEADVEQWLSQLREATGKSNGQTPNFTAGTIATLKNNMCLRL